MALWGRRGCLALAVAAVIGAWGADGAADPPSEPRYFRIGTGGVEGTYFPVGSLIAQGLTQPSSEAACAGAADCGVPGLIAVAQTSNGSVANVRSVAAKELEAALVQADVATWAYTGEGIFAGRDRRLGLRTVASLYPESLHVVVRKGLGVRSIADLRGLRLSLDEPGSGTLVDARAVLAAYGLAEADVHPSYVKPSLASAKMAEGQLDGFLIIAGHPAASVVALGEQTPIELVPIGSPAAAAIVAANPFFRPSTIPAGTYKGIGETPTLDVMAQMVVDASLADDLVYAVTRALWGERVQRLLRQGHPKGALIRPETALDGLAVPLHPGAVRYYREAGLLPATGGP